MENKKELLLDYLIQVIESEYRWYEGKNNLNKHAEGESMVYSKLYEIIKKYNN
jgi:hypothetical protein